MILKNIAKKLKKRDWATAAIELVIVVLGIIIGLQFDDWNQQRQDRNSSYETLALVAAELEKQRDLLHSNWQNGEKWEQHVVYLETVTEDPRRAAERPSKLLQAIYLSTFQSWHRPPMQVYHNADNSGSLTYIDEHTRAALHDHYEDLFYWSDIVDRLYLNHNMLDRALAGYLTIDHLNALDDQGQDLFGEIVVPDFTAEQAVDLARRLAADPEVVRSIPRAYFYHDSTADLSENYLPRIEALQEKVAVALGGESPQYLGSE